jgi:transposase
MFGPGGQAQLNSLELPRAYIKRFESLRDLIGGFDHHVAILEREIHLMLKHDPGYRAIQETNGVGRTIGAISVAEIGDVHRFRSQSSVRYGWR